MNSIKKKFVRVPNLSITESIREIGRNPHVDWVLILFVSSVVAILLILGGINLYTRVASGDIQSSDSFNSSSVKVFNTTTFSEITAEFDRKNTLETQAKRGYAGPTDPSL